MNRFLQRFRVQSGFLNFEYPHLYFIASLLRRNHFIVKSKIIFSLQCKRYLRCKVFQVKF